MSQFKFDEKEIKILSNFAGINPSMIIESDKLSVIDNSKSVIGYYTFDTQKDFEKFGIYEMNDLLAALSVFQNIPGIEVSDKYLTISDKNDKLTYFTTAQNLLPSVPDVQTKFSKISPELVFTMSADKLAVINKMATILKSKYVFFETVQKKIRITVADELESSNNSFEIYIEQDIKNNNLETPVKIPFSNLKILPGEYKVDISTKISRWTNLNNVVYFLSCSK